MLYPVIYTDTHLKILHHFHVPECFSSEINFLATLGITYQKLKVAEILRYSMRNMALLLRNLKARERRSHNLTSLFRKGEIQQSRRGLTKQSFYSKVGSTNTKITFFKHFDL